MSCCRCKHLPRLKFISKECIRQPSITPVTSFKQCENILKFIIEDHVQQKTTSNKRNEIWKKRSGYANLNRSLHKRTKSAI